LFAYQSHELLRALADRGATFKDCCAVLATPEQVVHCDEQLGADPVFARRFHERLDPLAGLERAEVLPTGSLGRCHPDYMSHYRLTPEFFPLPASQGAELTPLRHAIQLLNRCHDLLHVIGASRRGAPPVMNSCIPTSLSLQDDWGVSGCMFGRHDLQAIRYLESTHPTQIRNRRRRFYIGAADRAAES